MKRSQANQNTKKAACRLTGRNPTRKQYERPLKARPETMMAMPIPEIPHKLPPYGGPCFVQAYNERMAYERMCQKERDYQAAINEYNTLWHAMDECLNGTPV